MRFAAIVASGLLWAGCSGGATRIGPAGGTVSNGDVTVTIPKGALDREQPIAITTVGDAVPDRYTAASPRFRFEPAGIFFNRPLLLASG